MIIRQRKTIAVQIGSITIGGGAPICVQSMTNTDTADAKTTAAQVQKLAVAGSELVRITVNTEAAAKQVAIIRKLLDEQGCHVPLIGDFHYNGHTLLNNYPECAKALAKYRINPGNVGFGKKRDAQFETIVRCAIDYDKPVRIGVNGGSLDKALLTRLMQQNAQSGNPMSSKAVMREAMVQSALDSAELAEAIGLAHDKIILSCKVSQVQDLIAIYRELAKRCDYPLHLGLTEAGMYSKGVVATTAAFSILLQEGIGDTIRASLTPKPDGDRSLEVQVCQEILQTMGLRAFTPMVVACPGCGRTTSTVFQELAARIEKYIRSQMPYWKQRYPAVENLTLAVMGCVVNGPGESKQANIGISLPGTGELPAAPVFIDGKKFTTLRGDNIAQEFQAIVERYIETNYANI